MIDIRIARDEDAEILPDIERSAGQLFRTILDLSWIADEADLTVEQYHALIVEGTSWVAVDHGDRPIAFLSAQVQGHELHIWELAVRLDHQRKGLGRRLMGHTIDEARRRGLAAVTLTTFRDVIWKKPFYVRLGFRVLNTQELSPRLNAILQAEAERQFPMERRCAMRLPVG